jgi:hypothetical protein
MSQMDSDQFVPVWTLACMEDIKVLTTDSELILEVLKGTVGCFTKNTDALKTGAGGACRKGDDETVNQVLFFRYRPKRKRLTLGTKTRLFKT